MANGTTHCWTAAAVAALALRHEDVKQQVDTPLPLVGAALAAGLTNIPDWLEPATHPGHRKFFHSIAFAAVLGLGFKKLYDWNPNEDWEKALRFVGLVGVGAYLLHLALDATTPRSLPLVGP